MELRGLRTEAIVGAIMYYARKYLPLRRWQGRPSGAPRTVASFSLTPVSVDHRVLLGTIVRFLPEKKGRTYCQFLLGLLRLVLILDVTQECCDVIERRIGMQLDLVTLDGLLIPNYSDSDNLYDTDCVQRIIQHFLSSEHCVPLFSPASVDIGASPSSDPLERVAKLVDNYIGEVASDINLKPAKIRSLLLSLPGAFRSLHDGLYRALDIYFKTQPWLLEQEKEELCNTMDCQKLSIEACAHASQNERLLIRIVLQVMFFEQIHLRSAVAGCLQVMDAETDHPSNPITSLPNEVMGQNRGLKVEKERMTSRVKELEKEFGKMKHEMKKVGKIFRPFSMRQLFMGTIKCRLLPRPSEGQRDIMDSTGPAPRASVEQGRRRPSSYILRRRLKGGPF